MSGKKFNEIITEVKLAYNIYDYISQSGIQLKRRNNKSQGLCPFHNERTPSFTVDEVFQSYRCFGCGANGDIFAFVQNYENLTFYDSLKKLADDANIEINIQGKNESGVDYHSLRACIRDAANFYHTQFKKLDNDHPAKKQILDRGLSLKGMIYGYAPEGFDTLYKHLKNIGYSDETIMGIGVIRKSEKTSRFFDFWQGRLMFYITDTAGKVIGFSGRKLFDSDKMGKYVNSADSFLFNKSTSLFNIAAAKKKSVSDKVIYVTEGQFDVAAFVEAGLTNAVASSGTAFTEAQGNICRRLVTDEGKIVFCFDSDEAGIKAAIGVFTHIPILHNQAYVVSFPPGLDPSDYRNQNGSENLISLVEKERIPLIEFVLKELAKDFDMDSPLEKDQYIGIAAKALSAITSRSLKETYTARVALESFSSIQVIESAIKKAEEEAKNNQKSHNTASIDFVNGIEKRVKSSRHDSGNFDTVFEDELDFDTNDAYDPSETGLENNIDENGIIEKINNPGQYKGHSIVARMVLLTAINRGLSKDFIRMRKFIPKDIKWIIDDIESNIDSQRLIPELFQSEIVMQHVFSSQVIFPLLHVMNDKTVVEQFYYLATTLKKWRIDSHEELVKRKYIKILKDSKSKDADFLQRTLDDEKKHIQKIHEAYTIELDGGIK